MVVPSVTFWSAPALAIGALFSMTDVGVPINSKGSTPSGRETKRDDFIASLILFPHHSQKQRNC